VYEHFRAAIVPQSQQHLCTIYGVRYGSKEMATTMTYGMTLKDLESSLKCLIPSHSTILQWANNNCDYHAVTTSVSKDSVPKQWLQAIPAWRIILPQSQPRP
jgi:hypothetical protein